MAAEVKKLAVRPTNIGITTPIEGGVPKGKHMVLLQCAFPDCASLGTAVQAAAAKVGWSVTKIGIGTSPEKIAAAWQAALHKNPDAIIGSGAYPTAFYQRQLDEAVARKIPVVAFAEAHQGKPWTLVVGSGDGVGAVTADMAAKYVASRISGGKVLAVTIPGIGVIESEIAAFKQKLPQYCPKCEVDVLEVPPASIGTDAGKRIASYLQSHRDTKFGFLSVIDLVIGLKSALAANGLKPIPLIGQSTSPVGLDAIKNQRSGPRGHHRVSGLRRGLPCHRRAGEAVPRAVREARRGRDVHALAHHRGQPDRRAAVARGQGLREPVLRAVGREVTVGRSSTPSTCR